MESMRHILVALDFTEADQNLLRYARFLCDTLQPDTVYFIHALKPEWVPKAMEETYKGHIKQPIEDQLQEDIQEQVSNFFDENQTTLKPVIQKGQPQETVLKYSHEQDIDLIIVGEKQDERGSGILASQLTRKATCSILYVPDIHKEPRIENVLVPLDFSPYSDMALEFTKELQERNDVAKVFHLNLYQSVPSYNMMRTYGQMRSQMEANAKEAYQKYLEKLEFDINQNKVHPLFTLDEKNRPASLILKEAEKHYCDLIVMGSKGQSSAAAMFLGSTTEKLLRHDKRVPVLILKKKGENQSLLQALFYGE